MKKLVSLLSLLLMLCFFVGASAAGLGGLLGSTAAVSSGALPDPASVLDDDAYAMQTESNYDFGGGYFCNVYAYPTPISTTRFIQLYSPLAQAAGYTVNETVLDGFPAYEVSHGDGKCAYLVPEAGEQMLFLVEVGMDFSPEARRNFLSVEKNSVVREYDVWTAYTPKYYNHGYYEISFVLGDDYDGNSLQLRLPHVVNVGDTFFVSRKDGLIDDLRFSCNLNTTYYVWDSWSGRHQIKSDTDYFMVTITGKETFNGGERITGTLEGRFSNGETTFMNGVFSADCAD